MDKTSTATATGMPEGNSIEFGLSAQRIVEVTREIVFDAGFSGVSMRRIAAKLNVTSTAIYYHFRNKTALLDQVAEDIMRSIATPGPEKPWQERLRNFVLAMDQAMTDYPGLNRHMVNNRTSRAALRWTESILGILSDAGFTAETIRPAFAMLVFFIDPMTLVDDKRHFDEIIHDPGDLLTQMRSDAGYFPNIARYISAGDARTYKADYALALDRIIAAIAREIPD